MFAGRMLLRFGAVFALPVICGFLGLAAVLQAQETVVLPAAPAMTGSAAQTFSFASDGPAGPGWSRPDEIARTYFDEHGRWPDEE